MADWERIRALTCRGGSRNPSLPIHTTDHPAVTGSLQGEIHPSSSTNTPKYIPFATDIHRMPNRWMGSLCRIMGSPAARFFRQGDLET